MLWTINLNIYEKCIVQTIALILILTLYGKCFVRIVKNTSWNLFYLMYNFFFKIINFSFLRTLVKSIFEAFLKLEYLVQYFYILCTRYLKNLALIAKYALIKVF